MSETLRDGLYIVLGMCVMMVIVLGGVWAYNKMTWRPSFDPYDGGNGTKDGVSMAFVSGTEYVPEQAGQVIVEVRRQRTGESLANACNISVWYPDKTQFLSPSAATFDAGTGNAYVNFTVPSVEGIYEYQAKCAVANETLVASKSFHVSTAGLKAWTTT